jgi:SAM-dependent methyltransferase
VKLTGERPMQGATPDSLLALHDAGYREVVARLGPGLVLDVGCGVGDETARLGRHDRMVVGVDYSAQTARDAATEWGPGAHQGTAVRFAAMDGARLGLQAGVVDWACSSHIIEHFTNPALHVAELARVLAPNGTAFIITPNAPADFENPFHVYLFEPAHLRSLLSLFFSDVVLLGLEGDDALHEDFAARRASGERLLKLDVLGLRKKLPRRTYVWAYERLLPVVYRALGTKNTGIGSGLDASHLFLTEVVDATTPVLFAIARGPRPHVGQNGGHPTDGMETDVSPDDGSPTDGT